MTARSSVPDLPLETAVPLTAQADPLLDLPQTEVVLGNQTAIGGTWAVGARIVSRIIDLITMVILAHVLHPKDFGLVAIAMTVIYIVEAALELPVSQALVRLPTLNAGHYDTAFTLGLLRGLLLSASVCLISWPFARFYGDSRLVLLVCALSFAPASRGLVSPRLADCSKSFNFVPDFTMEFCGKLTAFLAAVYIALTTGSYWAVAAGTLIAPAVSTLVSYLFAPYRPRISLSELPSFSGFLGWITAAQIVSSINWQTDRLLLGKLTSRASLGLFTAANDTSNIPLAALLTPLLKPLLSAFTLLRNDASRLARSYQSSASAIVTLALPILIGESLIAEPFVRLIFGDKWLGAVPYLRWLAISLVPTLFAVPLGSLVMAFGKTNIFFKRNLFELSIKLPLVVLGAIHFGFMGVVLARGISETVTMGFCMVIVRRLIGVSIRNQLFAAWRSLLSAGVMAAVLALVLPQLTHSTSTFALGMGTVMSVLLAAVTYCTTLFSLWNIAGKPHGIESLAIQQLQSLIRVRRRVTA